MKPLDYFSRNYCFGQHIVEQGDIYKVYQLEFDKFYGQNAGKYRLIEALEAQNWQTADFMQRMLQYLFHIVEYFSGEYSENTNEEFNDIWKKFFEKWYFGTVYVCYSQEMLDVEIQSLEQRLDIDLDDIYPESKFRLFTLVKKHNQTLYEVSSVFSGIQYMIDTNKIPLVKASYNNGFQYIWWRTLLADYIALEQSFIQAAKLATKRVLRKTKDPTKADVENKQLMDLSPVFDLNYTHPVNKNEYELFDVMPADVPKEVLGYMIEWFGWRAQQMGYMQSSNEKKERLVTGEVFQDTHGLTNIQAATIKELTKFARNLNKKYPEIELNFGISNWGTSMGIPQGETTGEFEGEGRDEGIGDNNDTQDRNE